MNKKIYLEKIIQQIPRLLSLENRDSSSSTVGCFDRSYWAWKFTDFPNATLQRGVYVLSALYTNDFPHNIYYQNDQIKKCIKTGCDYWVKIQHANGSFDQAFPNEHSVGATAFTLLCLIKTYLICQAEFTPSEQKKMQRSFKKAATFLAKNQEQHGFISNHLAGVALALQLSSKVLADNNLHDRAQEIKSQSPEGWFKEYEGPDPGYETLGLSYLAQYYQASGNERLLSALEKALIFLSYSVAPDGSWGGHYGSRNTEIYYPAGMEILKNKIPLAQKISTWMSNAIANNQTVSMEAMDDHNLIPLLENYSDAFLTSTSTYDKTEINLPFEQANTQAFFKHAGLGIHGTSSYYLICNATKGGTLAIFDKKKQQLVWNDCGYLGTTTSNRQLTTQISNRQNFCDPAVPAITIKTQFLTVLNTTRMPIQSLILGLMSLTFFRSISFGNWFKKILVKKLIVQKRPAAVWLTRQITLNDYGVVINDQLTKKSRIKFTALTYGQKFSAIHMGSANYFSKNDLLPLAKPTPINLDEFNSFNQVTVKTQLNF